VRFDGEDFLSRGLGRVLWVRKCRSEGGRKVCDLKEWGPCFNYVMSVNGLVNMERGNSVVTRKKIGVLMEFIGGWR